MTTRDDLIEALARHESHMTQTWELSSPWFRQTFRDDVEREMMPLIVDFVEAWLKVNADNRCSETSLDEVWREEMAPAPSEEGGGR